MSTDNPLEAFREVATEHEVALATGEPERTLRHRRKNGTASQFFIFNRIPFYVVRRLPAEQQASVREVIARRKVKANRVYCGPIAPSTQEA